MVNSANSHSTLTQRKNICNKGWESELSSIFTSCCQQVMVIQPNGSSRVDDDRSRRMVHTGPKRADCLWLIHVDPLTWVGLVEE